MEKLEVYVAVCLYKLCISKAHIAHFPLLLFQRNICSPYVIKEGTILNGPAHTSQNPKHLFFVSKACDRYLSARCKFTVSDLKLLLHLHVTHRSFEPNI